MARSTVFRYKGKEPDPQKVGEDLHVRAVLVSRLLQRGDTLVINTELVDTEKGSQFWGTQYKRKLADILRVQEEISRDISENLRLRLTGEEKQRLRKHSTENAEAYQLYLKGRYYSNKASLEGLKKSVDYFQQAIEKDPGNALAYAGLANSYGNTGDIFPIFNRKTLVSQSQGGGTEGSGDRRLPGRSTRGAGNREVCLRLGLARRRVWSSEGRLSLIQAAWMRTVRTRST